MPQHEAAQQPASRVASLPDLIGNIETLHTPVFLENLRLGDSLGRLGVIRITNESAAGMWERHDDGDELLLVIEGRMTMRVRAPRHDAVLEAGPGDIVFIAQGAEHTATIHTAEVRLAFLTPMRRTHVWRERAA